MEANTNAIVAVTVPTTGAIVESNIGPLDDAARLSSDVVGDASITDLSITPVGADSALSSGTLVAPNVFITATQFQLSATPQACKGTGEEKGGNSSVATRVRLCSLNCTTNTLRSGIG